MTAMTIAEAQRRVSEFLTGQLAEALGAVEYDRAGFDDDPGADESLQAASRADVAVRHVAGASDALYRVRAFGDELLVQVQLNVQRFVLVYRIPAREGSEAEDLHPRFAMWERGAQNVGWATHWRDAASYGAADERYVEIYCYADAAADLLRNAMAQLFWRTDIVQMTRSLMLEAHRLGVRLSPRAAGYAI